MPVARLVIVEDERITAEDLRDILTELGYAVVSIVSTGKAAVAEVEREAPDLVLMDIRIQGHLDGAETARILRERFDLPVVFLTAHSNEGTLSRARAAEPLGYIVKPFQEAELHATIEMALYKSRADLTAGLILSLALARVWATWTQETSRDPRILVAVMVLLSVAAGAACLMPARRASSIDPMAALRYE